MTGLDVASFVVGCVGLALAIVAFIVAYAAWSAEFKNHRWRLAHERLLKWNEAVLALAEDALADPEPLKTVEGRPVFDAPIRIYARHQASLDIETVFLDPVFQTPGARSYQSGVMGSIRSSMSVIAMQWPYASGYVNHVEGAGAWRLKDDEAVRSELQHLRERCGVFDRFTRETPEPSRLRIAWRTFTSLRSVREARKINASDPPSERHQVLDLWLG